MIEHFINSSDASRVFSDFFEKAHRRMHEILDYNYSCVKINLTLSIFFKMIKYFIILLVTILLIFLYVISKKITKNNL